MRRSLPNSSGYRYVVSASVIDNHGPTPTRQPTGTIEEIECKVLIVAAGAMGTPPLLLRSRAALPSLSDRVGKHLGVNGDHVAGVEYDPAKARALLGGQAYGQFYKGRPITTMTYDFWTGRGDHRFDGTRFTLQEIFLSTLTNFLYDDGRPGDPSWFGLDKKRSISTWNDHIELLAMVEDTNDGEFTLPPPDGGAVRPNAGPIGVGLFNYAFSERVAARARRGERGHAPGGRARRAGALPGAGRDARRLLRAPARRLPDGGVEGPRRGRSHAARRSTTRGSSASTPRRSRRRSA